MTDLLDNNFSEVANVEDYCKVNFDVDLKIKDILLNNAPTSLNSQTTIFKDDQNMMYALYTSDERMTLAEVMNLVKSMGMEADEYLAPGGDKDYFLRFGYKLFMTVFPNLKPSSAKEISYYKTFTPYSPALVRISKVTSEIREYNRIWKQWQKSLNFSYNRMRTQ